ncbi:MAG: fumarylacetoacetate hydrolase family protein [Actinomycetota bacterium]
MRGRKIGCTSIHAQELLGTDGPFSGRVYDLHDTGFTLAGADVVTEPLLEGEFAFVLGRDLAPTPSRRSRDEVVAAVAAIRPAIEVVGGRWAQFLGAPVRALMADAGANTRLVVGPATTDWDPDALADTAATMTVDGEVTGQGHGRDVLGDPVEALRWLVDRLSARGITLPTGVTITTGTATQVSPLPAGATAVNRIDGLGSVELHRAG